MLKAILVPLDGSTTGEEALPVAEHLARRAGATLHLATVYVPPSALLLAGEAPAAAAALDDDARRRTEAYLERSADAARCAQGLSVTATLLEGPPAVALAHYARAHHMDLVVMTTHGRGGLSRWWLGSVADRLLRRTTVPVLLLPPRAHPQAGEFHRILVALGGESDETVLEPAVGIAGLGSGTALHLVRVVPPSVPIMSPLTAFPAPARPDWAKRREIEARTALARTASRLEGRGVQASTEVLAAENVAEAVLDQAGAMAADLIIVGTHGAGGVERLILGSVADKVIRGAGRPVLVVPVAPG